MRDMDADVEGCGPTTGLGLGHASIFMLIEIGHVLLTYDEDFTVTVGQGWYKIFSPNNSRDITRGKAPLPMTADNRFSPVIKFEFIVG